MNIISFYDSTGKITGSADFPPGVADMIKEHTAAPFVDGLWLDLPVYVVDGNAVNRPDNPTTLTGRILSNVPVPATIKINADSYASSESEVELSFNQPGTYTVKVIAWPHLDKEFQIENPA